MTQYNLPFTGVQINEAIEKARVHVVGLDTSPQQGSNKVVNSDGIYTAVNAKISTSDIVTESQTIAANDVDTKVPSAAAVKDYVDNNILWGRTQMTMSNHTGGLTWSNTIKHSSFTGFSTSGQQITVPTGTYFINVTWANAFESHNIYTFADWYLMEGSQTGNIVFHGIINNGNQSFGSSIIISGGNYFMKLVNGYVTGTVYVNVIKIGV